FVMIVVTAKDPSKNAEFYQVFAARGISMMSMLGGGRGSTRALDSREVKITLPRFKAESSADLTRPLMSLGLGPVFTTGADFRSLTSVNIHATSVLQRAIVEVNEQGTEAAAATAITATRSLDAAPPVAFAADRPFGFAIVDKATAAVLFMGYVADP